ncbi:uridylate kinase [Methylomonas sp. LL1]|uniref:amino acid kinase family protein n=1 Tax=Methylomonas sp. LL1 TaxID=2785785 RepID=UPI0018C3A5CD|nr:uridylate kinase [Methylomonas sp. LL1]QPK64138.1 uridylate kinase [Methylomonas sp. LL1]
MITVIKLGGSLLEASVLPACLDAVERYPGKILIVPGGGVFAEQVRIAQKRWGFDDLAAHRMAILAMRQMALLFNSLKPQFGLFDSVAKSACLENTGIWSPSLPDLERAGIAASWDITSDSLAAWLADQVEADRLILVKSAAVAENSTWAELQAQGILDKGFVEFAAHARFNILVINKDRFLSAA